MSWTDERVEQLKQHWLEGKSASQIANLLGHGLTRNAVIGKVHRLGLPAARNPRASSSSHPRPSAPAPAAHRVAVPRAASARAADRRGATALAIATQPLNEAEHETFESVVLPMSLRVTIVELKEAMCRWPLGDPSEPGLPLLRLAGVLGSLLRPSQRAGLSARSGASARAGPRTSPGVALGRDAIGLRQRRTARRTTLTRSRKQTNLPVIPWVTGRNA